MSVRQTFERIWDRYASQIWQTSDIRTGFAAGASQTPPATVLPSTTATPRSSFIDVDDIDVDDDESVAASRHLELQSWSSTTTDVQRQVAADDDNDDVVVTSLIDSHTDNVTSH